MICELFKNLRLKDLAACSLVNKRWNSIYSGFRVHRLVIVESYFDHENKWYHSDRLIEDNEWCCSKVFNVLFASPLLSNLKYLALPNRRSEFDLNRLNSFDQLRQLEIRG